MDRFCGKDLVPLAGHNWTQVNTTLLLQRRQRQQWTPWLGLCPQSRGMVFLSARAKLWLKHHTPVWWGWVGTRPQSNGYEGRSWKRGLWEKIEITIWWREGEAEVRWLPWFALDFSWAAARERAWDTTQQCSQLADLMWSDCIRGWRRLLE